MDSEPRCASEANAHGVQGRTETLCAAGPAIANMSAFFFSRESSPRKKGLIMNTKFLVSLGSTLAATKLAQTVTHLQTNDLLRIMGLSRRRSHMAENLALVGLGALVGAGAALLFAPATGIETRERVASELGRVKDRTVDALRDAKRQAPALLHQMKETAKNEMSSSYNT
jgi:hypothetical protein